MAREKRGILPIKKGVIELSGYNGYTKARAEANERYSSKTYKKLLFRLRLVEDADILKSIQQAQDNGLAKRVWLREVFDAYKREKAR